MKIWILKSHGIHGCLVDIAGNCLPYKPCGIAYAHFLDQVESVGFYCAKTDKKFVGYFLGGIFLHDQLEDFFFSFCQRSEGRTGFAYF